MKAWQVYTDWTNSETDDEDDDHFIHRKLNLLSGYYPRNYYLHPHKPVLLWNWQPMRLAIAIFNER